MSDIRRVEFDTKRAVISMNQPVVLETRNMFETLVKREHRGPSDTWTAARDRTAIGIGIEPAQARRLWQRWQDMKDVPGSVYRAVRNAYDNQCARQAETAAHYRKLREAMNDGGPSDQDGDRSALRVGALSPLADAPSPRPVP